MTTDVSFTSAGTYTLQLSADDGELTASDTLVVTVEAAPVLTQLDVTPAAVTLLVGEGRTFSASGLDQYGAAIATSVTWTATGGTIDQVGNYIAGTTPGSFSVTATDGSVSGNASVTITDNSQPPVLSFTDITLLAGTAVRHRRPTPVDLMVGLKAAVLR